MLRCTCIIVLLLLLLSLLRNVLLFDDDGEFGEPPKFRFLTGSTLSNITYEDSLFLSSGNVTLIMPTDGDAVETIQQCLRDDSTLVRSLCAPTYDAPSTSLLTVNVVVVRLATVMAPEWAQQEGMTAVRESDIEVTGRLWNHWSIRDTLATQQVTAKGPAMFCRIGDVRLVAPAPQWNEDTCATCAVREEWLYDTAVKAGLTASGEQTPYFAVIAESLVPVVVPRTHSNARGRGGGFLQRLISPLRHNNGRVAAVQCTILTNKAHSSSAAAASGASGGLSPNGWRGGNSSCMSVNHVVLDRGARVGFGASPATGVTSQFLTLSMLGYDARDARVQEWEEPLDAVSPYCGLFHRQLFDMAGGFLYNLEGDAFNSMKPDAPGYMGWSMSLRISHMQPEVEFWSSTALAVAWRSLDLRCSILPVREEGQRQQQQKKDKYCRFSPMRASYVLNPQQTRKWGNHLAERARRRVMSYSWEAAQYGTPALHVTSNTTQIQGGKLVHISVHNRYCNTGCSGMMLEMLHYVAPLQSWGIPFSFVGHKCRWCKTAPLPVLDGLYRTQWVTRIWKSRVTQFNTVSLFHDGPTTKLERFGRVRQRPGYAVGRIITEMSRISAVEVERIHRHLDEVWAPSSFFKSIYERSGVKHGMIHVIPESIDAFTFDPALQEPIDHTLPAVLAAALGKEGIWSNRPLDDDAQPQQSGAKKRRHRFLSVFKWEFRKGWDVLLKAYWEAFGSGKPHHDDVVLYIKVNFLLKFSDGVSFSTLPRFLEHWVRDTMQLPITLADFPPIVIIGVEGMSQDLLLRLYRSVDAFVLPTRAEGWGVPAMEAMSMALPVLTTNWGGSTAFATRENSFLIPVDGLEELPPRSVYGYEPGKKYAMPSVAGTAALMQYVLQHPEHAREVGRRARRSVEANYTEEVVASQMVRRLREIAQPQRRQ
ncbi:putative mannosyltransferase-like protein [Trypanosoma grayi]|uniref:putative mannosyltransferase-like protein n=1 Tax=Trypanosoma grayi TaxID=71804 RepID=UPI0004F40DCC|nr:putative mannosyltransferase-like protein [Trypanosoma grayi]KEG09871.1 putative mannosyltransferase-like protein [Trypanosoma grayi]